MTQTLLAWVLGALALHDPIPIEDQYTEIKIAPAAMQRIVLCNSLHLELRLKNPDPRDRRDAWLKERTRCEGTGLYEFLLGLAHEQSGDLAAARTAYQSAVRGKMPYYEDSVVALNSLEAEAAFATTPPDLRRARQVRDELATFAASHPGFAFAYTRLAAQSNGLGDWDAAAEYARKALSLRESNWQTRKYLVIALHGGEKCAEATRDIRPAIELRSELMADPNFMFPAIDCYAEAGEFKLADAAMRAFLTKNPAMQSDPRTLQLQGFLKSKLPAASKAP